MRTIDARHPGELLKAILKKLRVTQASASRAMNIPGSRLTDLIHGRRGITSDTAYRLGVFLGSKYNAKFWLMAQFRHDVTVDDLISEPITPHIPSKGRPKKSSYSTVRKVKESS